MKAPYRPSLEDILFLRRPSCWKNLPPLKSAQAFQKMNFLQERRIYSSSSSIESSSVSSSSSSSSESSREEPNSSENSSSSSSSFGSSQAHGVPPVFDGGESGQLVGGSFTTFDLLQEPMPLVIGEVFIFRALQCQFVYRHNSVRVFVRV